MSSSDAIPAPHLTDIDEPSQEDTALRALAGQRDAVFRLAGNGFGVDFLGRKGFPVVKSTLSERLGLSVGMLGAIDTAYLTAYAIGQFINGALGDRIGSRRLI